MLTCKQHFYHWEQHIRSELRVFKCEFLMSLLWGVFLSCLSRARRTLWTVAPFEPLWWWCWSMWKKRNWNRLELSERDCVHIGPSSWDWHPRAHFNLWPNVLFVCLCFASLKYHLIHHGFASAASFPLSFQCSWHASHTSCPLLSVSKSFSPSSFLPPFFCLSEHSLWV